MNENQMRLTDAGIREHEFALTIIKNKLLPANISYEDLLAHGVYDASNDEITLTVKGVSFSFKVA